MISLFFFFLFIPHIIRSQDCIVLKGCVLQQLDASKLSPVGDLATELKKAMAPVSRYSIDTSGMSDALKKLVETPCELQNLDPAKISPLDVSSDFARAMHEIRYKELERELVALERKFRRANDIHYLLTGLHAIAPETYELFIKNHGTETILDAAKQKSMLSALGKTIDAELKSAWKKRDQLDAQVNNLLSDLFVASQKKQTKKMSECGLTALRTLAMRLLGVEIMQSVIFYGSSKKIKKGEVGPQVCTNPDRNADEISEFKTARTIEDLLQDSAIKSDKKLCKILTEFQAARKPFFDARKQLGESRKLIKKICDAKNAELFGQLDKMIKNMVAMALDSADENTTDDDIVSVVFSMWGSEEIAALRKEAGEFDKEQFKKFILARLALTEARGNLAHWFECLIKQLNCFYLDNAKSTI